MNKIKTNYDRYGNFRITNFFSKDEIEEILKDLESTNNGIQYLDENSILRRIEKVTYNIDSLKKANDKIINLLNKIFNQKMILFKDKYNVKPPNGEGFYAHYDGIFMWEDKNGKKHNGWHEYSDEFFNVLIALDKSDDENGTLEVANENHNKLTFKEMLQHTLGNGTPQLKKEVENSMKFHKVMLNPGDIVLFSNRCPHRSEKNKSYNRYRRILYFTYNKLEDGNNYEKYFLDKKSSNKNNNISKALSNRKENY